MTRILRRTLRRTSSLRTAVAATATLSQLSSLATVGVVGESAWWHPLAAATCALHQALHSRATFCPTASDKTIESRTARNT